MPVGVPAPRAIGSTVAVKVTVWPTAGVALELVRLVVVAAGFTVKPTSGLVDEV